jgi:hypothetical protein
MAINVGIAQICSDELLMSRCVSTGLRSASRRYDRGQIIALLLFKFIGVSFSGSKFAL